MGYSVRISKYRNTIVANNLHSGFRIHLRKLVNLTHIILKKLKYTDVILSLVFVSDAQMKQLNRKFLNHSWATDVLAFPFSGFTGHQPLPSYYFFMGEVIVSPKRAKVYAARFKIPFEEEFVRYICHGILHLKGYSDHSTRKKKQMRHIEDQLLNRLGPGIRGVI